MEENLSIYNLEGTDFLVDVIAREMREYSNPMNSMGFHEMDDNGRSYSFDYDLITKNISYGTVNPTTLVEIPQMRHFDPLRMALHYRVPLASLIIKTDYEIIVDQELVNQRLSGALPIIELIDHPFYVDERLGTLRPKDDFRTMGIYFDDMEEVSERELGFVYDPKTHAIAELDLSTINMVPKDIYLLQIPKPHILDPIGWARNHCFDIKEIAREFPPQRNLKATVYHGVKPRCYKLLKTTFSGILIEILETQLK